MSNLRQAAQQALEFLSHDTVAEDWPHQKRKDAVCDALRAALAEPRPIQECYGDCPTNPQTCPNPCNFEGRPKPEQKSWFTVEELNEFATKLKEKAWKA